MSVAQNGLYLRSGTVSEADPDYLWRSSEKEATLTEIIVFGDNRETTLGGIVPYRLIGSGLQPDFANVIRLWVDICE